MNQSQEILAYLQSGRSLTPLEALDKFGCFRLGARVWDLEQKGYKIKTEFITENGKTFARYSIFGEAQSVEVSSPLCHESTGESERTHGAEAVNSEPTPSPIFFDDKNKNQTVFDLGYVGK